MFAETHNFVGLGAHLEGPVDIDALSTAFDSLLEAYPLLGGRIEPGSDGRHQFVVDDLVHPGIEVVKLDDATADPPVHLDQSESLAQLRLTIRDGQTQLTLYIHHSLADGHHQFSLVEELFSYYTDLVSTGSIRPVIVHPAPEPLEVALAERRIDKQQRSGLERFMPAMFAYDLPPSRRASTEAKPALPLHVPVARCRLTEEHTRALIAFCRSHRIRYNAVLSAAILLAEWRLRDTPNIPVPYIYPVDLRYILSPPLSATACTNPLGVATYLAEIDHNTDVVELARDIAQTFEADVSDGVIQQSLLHFSPQYVGNAPGLPDVVMLTDTGSVPSRAHTSRPGTVRMPKRHVLCRECRNRHLLQRNIRRPNVDRAPFACARAEESIEAIRSLLCTIAEQHATTGVI